MKKNKIDKILPSIRIPLDRIGSGIDIVNRIIENNKPYQKAYEEGKKVSITFNALLAESENFVLDNVDFQIINLVRSIEKDKKQKNQSPIIETK